MSLQRIRIEFIDHEQQSYSTSGDWKFLPSQEDPDMLVVYVSSMGDLDMQLCVAIHELIEARLCMKDKIKESDVTDFDIAYEEKRPRDDYSEPGNDPDAPYHEQHLVATEVEEKVADALEVNWRLYAEKINQLSKEG